MAGMAEELWDLLAPYLAVEGIELYDLELLGGGSRRLLRVTITSEKGLDIEEIAEVSRNLSRLLDIEDVIPGPYTLEVSSPGLERKLTRLAHFHKAVGSEVVVNARSGQGVTQSHRGLLLTANDTELVIQAPDGPATIPLTAVTSARTTFEMKSAPKPGKRRQESRT